MSQQPATDASTSHAALIGVAVAANPALRAAVAQIPATGSWDKRAWALMVAAIVRRHAAAAASLAVRHYRQERRAAGVTQPFTPRPIEPTMAQLGSATDWTLGTLYGDGGTPQAAESNLLTASERLLLNSYRDTITTNAEQDRQARAWARETSPGCCWFCSMLATRGAIYTSAEAAGLAAPKSGQTPTGLNEHGKEFVNRYHNNCRCRVVPVFNVFEPSAHVRDWQALWNRTMNPPGGKPVTGMANMQAAWKAAFADWQSQQ